MQSFWVSLQLQMSRMISGGVLSMRLPIAQTLRTRSPVALKQCRLSRADIGEQAVRRYGSGRMGYRAMYVRMQSAKSGVSRVLGLLSIKTACLRQAVRHCHVLTVTPITSLARFLSATDGGTRAQTRFSTLWM
jgi:hypothetical protein